MHLINREVNLLLTWSASCVIVSTDVANQNEIYTITDTKLYVPVVTLSQQDNAKLLEQLQSGFKRVVNWNYSIGITRVISTKSKFKSFG